MSSPSCHPVAGEGGILSPLRGLDRHPPKPKCAKHFSEIWSDKYDFAHRSQILDIARGRTRAMETFLGIEIGGTKLQLVLADAQIHLAEHRRFTVEPSQGAGGVRLI